MKIRFLCAILISFNTLVHADNDLDGFDKAVFGNNAEGINPLTHEELKSYKAQLDSGNLDSQDPAYNAAFKKAFQLSPDDVKEIKRYNDRLKAEEARPAQNYRGVSSSDKLDLSPGAEIQVIRLAQEYSCTLSFLDSTGQPWPIAGFTPRNSKVFTVTNPDHHSHILEISSKDEYAKSNISVMFKGLKSPIVIELISGFSVDVDFQKELHLPLSGPNAVQHTSNAPVISDNVMLDFLDNVPPSSATLKNTAGESAGTIIWEFEGYYYIRSKAWLQIPPPLQRRQSSDGTRVYKTRKSPSLSMSHNGHPLQILIRD